MSYTHTHTEFPYHAQPAPAWRHRWPQRWKRWLLSSEKRECSYRDKGV
jgi:hypothetical protein